MTSLLAQAAAPAATSQFATFLPIIIMFAAFYFLMVRPQQKKEKKRLQMISELRAGKTILCANGIVGTILEAKEDRFIIESAGGRLEILRNAVSECLDPTQPTR